ncbi:Cytochrome c2 [Bradyrhizobium sp.]|nr:Cytochrome c2 [Bradyrhizobium sp.]
MTKLIFGALTILTAIATAPAAMAQDAAAGKSSFNKCLACHAIGEGAKNKVGPELNGLDGRKSGTAPDYNYSDANKNSGITWNEAQFKEYIKDPKAKIPGTKMHSPASRTKPRSTISGPTCRSSTRTGRSSSKRATSGVLAAKSRGIFLKRSPAGYERCHCTTMWYNGSTGGAC